MEALRTNNKVNIKRCSQCQEGTEFYCHICKKEFCIECKNIHTLDVDSKYHHVTPYRYKFDNRNTNETCATHNDNIFKMYCEYCGIPVCFQCDRHEGHTLRELKYAYNKNIRHIINIRRRYIVTLPALLSEIMKIPYKNEIDNHLLTMKVKSQRLQNEIDLLRAHFVLESTFPQLFENHVAMTQNFEMKYGKIISNTPVNFLKLIKGTPVPQIDDTPKDYLVTYLNVEEQNLQNGEKDCSPDNAKQNPEDQNTGSKVSTPLRIKEHFPTMLIIKTVMPYFGKKRTPSFPLEIKKDRLIKFLSGVRITKKEKYAENDPFLKLTDSFEFERSLLIYYIEDCFDISFVPPDQLWINAGDFLYLINTTGDVLRHIKHVKASTANEWGTFYIDEHFSINYLSDGKTNSTFKTFPENFQWRPLSVYCCLSNGDLFVGMITSRPFKGVVIRYNHRGEKIQTIQYDSKDRLLYKYPRYLTENSNGDVVVSDSKRGKVVVTDRQGMFRFVRRVSRPRGICTDPFSNILVCQYMKNIKVMDKNGQLLTYFVTKPRGILRKVALMKPEKSSPLSISYDVNNDLLWVGTNKSNKVCAYKYLNREIILNGKFNISILTISLEFFGEIL